MTSHSPHVSSWPSQREEDDGLELLGSTGSRAAHQVSDAPSPSTRPAQEGEAPSIVIAPQAEVPMPPSGTRKKRVAEATLVIRDKRRVEEIRAGVQRMARAKARQRLGTVILWGGASALAFGFGAVVAFLAASGGTRQAGVLEAVASALPGGAPEQTSNPSQEAAAVPAPVPSQAPSRVEAAARGPVVSLSDLPDAPSAPVRMRAQPAVAEPAPSEPEVAEAAADEEGLGQPPASEASAPRAAPPEPEVIILEDL